ncbi:UDP-glycosyltransferase 708G1-like [Henckelia pumila]|uniref:UDP-glycosyltransferase 708G1-like n=1 Tax=Henckelia pumila TaxID=405737 RepID=UPI003C6E0D0D
MTQPHVALFPCPGMGSLIPFLRLAATLAGSGCTVTVITLHPTVSAAESNQIASFFTAKPHINRVEFQPLSFVKSKFLNIDPFFIQVEAISNSVHLLDPILAALSPPLSAIICDFQVSSSMCRFASQRSISTYVLATTSAIFFSLLALIPRLPLGDKSQINGHIELPGLRSVPTSSIAPQLLDSNHFMSALFDSNIPSLSEVKGILANTCAELESDTIEALNSGRVIPDLAPVLAIGPFDSFEAEKSPNLPWLDEQAPGSVLFVSFGSRMALPIDQILELSDGLEKSGCKFLWVLKTNKVDKDDKEEVQTILGESFLERTKEQGLVVKGWVNQDQILAHPAIGGFLSHCGWNSVTEATRLGVPILAWPLNGDQKLNAEVVQKAGIGLWADWGWRGEMLVAGDDIARKISALMTNEKIRVKSKEVKEKVAHAREIGEGDFDVLLRGLTAEFKPKNKDKVCLGSPDLIDSSK